MPTASGSSLLMQTAGFLAALRIGTWAICLPYPISQAAIMRSFIPRLVHGRVWRNAPCNTLQHCRGGRALAHGLARGMGMSFGISLLECGILGSLAGFHKKLQEATVPATDVYTVCHCSAGAQDKA